MKLQHLLTIGFFGQDSHPDMLLSVTTGQSSGKNTKSRFDSDIFPPSIMSIPRNTTRLCARRTRRQRAGRPVPLTGELHSQGGARPILPLTPTSQSPGPARR